MSLRSRRLFFLSIVTISAFFVHGYHPATEDAEIYLPGIQKILQPSLFPFNQEFFASHAKMTLFPNLIAGIVRMSHLSLFPVLLVCQLLSIFLLLLACLKLAEQLFDNVPAQWAGVCLVAALLTIPVAGTAIYIMDPYLDPRSIALFCATFAIEATFRKRYIAAAIWTIFAAAVHPLMSVFGLSLILAIVWLRDFGGFPLVVRVATTGACLLPIGISFTQPSPAYRAIVETRSYFFLFKWHWCEWLGIVGPFLLLWWFSVLSKKRNVTKVCVLCRSLMVFEAFYFVFGLLFSIPQLLEFVRYQPLRSLQLVYLFLALIGGGMLSEYLLRNKVWRWLALFIPLCFGMFYGQRQLYPATPHIEWPGVVPHNDWLRAFAWIRQNTPQNAIFALDPNHMWLPGEDEHGFRALTERTMLADANKDCIAVAMFPDIPGFAERCVEQVQAAKNWEHFSVADFQRLQATYGVTWVVVQQPGVAGIICPYENRTLRVCRLE